MDRVGDGSPDGVSAATDIASAALDESRVRILACEAARDAAQAASALFRKASAVPPSKAFFARDFTTLWREIAAGGWLTVGFREAAGGPGFHLVDLALIAEAWGRCLVPLPFLPTLLVLRWAGQSASRFEGEQLTYALLRDPDSRASSAIGPFIDARDTQLATRIAPLAVEAVAAADRPGEKEPWSPSMPLAAAPAATSGLPPGAEAEIAVLGIAELIGCGSAVLEQSVAYARARVQFDRPIAEYQAVQHLLADMHRDLEIARTALVCAANGPERAAGPIAIAWDCIRRVIERSIQIHGGLGFTWEGGLHYYLRHAWAWGRLLRACGVPALPGVNSSR